VWQKQDVRLAARRLRVVNHRQRVAVGYGTAPCGNSLHRGLSADAFKSLPGRVVPKKVCALQFFVCHCLHERPLGRFDLTHGVLRKFEAHGRRSIIGNRSLVSVTTLLIAKACSSDERTMNVDCD
jgi:hypothetical protein